MTRCGYCGGEMVIGSIERTTFGHGEQRLFRLQDTHYIERCDNVPLCQRCQHYPSDFTPKFTRVKEETYTIYPWTELREWLGI